MERGSPPDSVVTSDRRVYQPVRKHRGMMPRFAALRHCDARHGSRCSSSAESAAVIHTERFRAAFRGHFVEAGLGEQQRSSAGGLLQPNYDSVGGSFE